MSHPDLDCLDQQDPSYRSQHDYDHMRFLENRPVNCLLDVAVSLRLVRLVILCVLQEHFVHVGGGVLKQLKIGKFESSWTNIYFSSTAPYYES